MNVTPMDADAFLRYAQHHLSWMQNLRDMIYAVLRNRPISFYIAVAILYFASAFTFFLWLFRKAPRSKMTMFFVHRYRQLAMAIRKRRSQAPKPTRLFQGIAFTLIFGAWILAIFHLLPIVSSRPEISSIHIFIINLGFFTSLATFYLACTIQAGTITELTMLKFDNYEYDDILFVPDRICPTAKIRKLARSKYCRMSQRHVPRFDHFCIWLNQAVGEENHRYFYMFVMSTAIVSCYGIYIISRVFAVLLKEANAELFRPEKLWVKELSALVTTLLYSKEHTWKDILLWNWRRIIPATMYFMLEGFLDALRILGVEFEAHPELPYLCALFMECIWIGPTLSFLGIAHTVLICKNKTTNESMKWRKVRHLYWKRKTLYDATMKKGENKVVDKDIAETSESIIDNVAVSFDGAKQNEITIDDTKEDVPMNYMEKLQKMDEGTDPGPLPEDIYNLGIMKNIYEVFYPRSERKDVTVKWVTFLLEEDKRRKQEVHMNPKKDE